MYYKNLFIILSTVIILILIKVNITTNKVITTTNKVITTTNKVITTPKPYLWYYWEDTNKKRPEYIDLCIDSMYKYCSNSFNIIHLNNNNIDKYLPELKIDKMDFSRLKIAQKVDFYRILLMYKYGGIYIDVDVLVLKDLISIYDKLKDYDFVGFGCTGNICKNGFGKPSNWLLCSRPNTKLMKNILNRYNLKLNEINKVNNFNFNYHDFGKLLIWDELKELIERENYTYYHYSNLYDGTRDINGKWVNMSRLFSVENIIYDKPNDLLFIVLYNSNATEDIKNLTKNELLNSNYFISKYFRQSIN
jgi:hypothetical protein